QFLIDLLVKSKIIIIVKAALYPLLYYKYLKLIIIINKNVFGVIILILYIVEIAYVGIVPFDIERNSKL
ncbi:MAG: hypothetical protein DRQ78_02800, partial [Epsilonproteobacteria bacterium]